MDPLGNNEFGDSTLPVATRESRDLIHCRQCGSRVRLELVWDVHVFALLFRMPNFTQHDRHGTSNRCSAYETL
jgi:hypothetical protein